jgi:hypothetical protein
VITFLVVIVFHIIAGVLIGTANTSWLEVFVSSLIYGFAVWYIIGLFGVRSEYKPGTILFFGSPALTRFIVWWTTAFTVSLTVGALTYGVHQFL